MLVFPNAIRGTTAGTPGTGAFTPNAAASGWRAWSTVPTGWWGLVRFEDGSAWELSYSYWNGTTLSRSANQLFDSSTGSALSLSSSATAALIVDGSSLPRFTHRLYESVSQVSNGASVFGAGGVATGTVTSVGLGTTSLFGEQPRGQYASATTANAQAGLSTGVGFVQDNTAGRGGGRMIAIWGPNALPTGPRLMAGFLRATYVAVTTEPSAQLNFAAFAQDSTDTNIQFMVNGGGSTVKTDTGIAMVAATSWFYSSVWFDPGGNIHALLVRLDTGDIWYGNVSTGLPTTGAMVPNLLLGLNGTNIGTAAQLHIGRFVVMTGNH